MANITLKDAAGREKNYFNVPKVWIKSENGTELIPFTYGETVSKSISPDFSTGNMTFTMPNGQLAKDLTIIKPENLVSRYIAEGVNIAGVIGSLISTGGGGESGGNLCVKAGSFKTPFRSLVFSTGFYKGQDGCTKMSNGYWQKVNTPALGILVGGATYTAYYREETRREAVSHTLFNTYGKCVTLGNEYLVTGNQEDNTHEDWLVIYQSSYNRTTIFVADMPSDINDSNGNNYTINNLSIWMFNSADAKITVSHGEQTKPDAVFVMMSDLTSTPGNYISGAWGIRYDLNQMTPNNYVGVLSMLHVSLISRTSSLDNSYNSLGYLYCPDEYNFAMDASANTVAQLKPDATYTWFAFWGIPTE